MTCAINYTTLNKEVCHVPNFNLNLMKTWFTFSIGEKMIGLNFCL